jgi:hypothetical protein
MEKYILTPTRDQIQMSVWLRKDCPSKPCVKCATPCEVKQYRETVAHKIKPPFCPGSHDQCYRPQSCPECREGNLDIATVQYETIVVPKPPLKSRLIAQLEVIYNRMCR